LFSRLLSPVDERSLCMCTGPHRWHQLDRRRRLHAAGAWWGEVALGLRAIRREKKWAWARDAAAVLPQPYVYSFASGRTHEAISTGIPQKNAALHVRACAACCESLPASTHGHTRTGIPAFPLDAWTDAKGTRGRVGSHRARRRGNPRRVPGHIDARILAFNFERQHNKIKDIFCWT
jgi:hypothetical protein